MTYRPPFVIEHRPSNFANAFVRTFAPKVLLVVHVTGNKDVAAYPEGFDAKESPGADWAYAAKNVASKDGPSAHDYIGRKTGATIQMWDPRTHAAWSNGDLDKPNTKLPGVAYLVGLKTKGINANRGCYREVELSGFPGSFDPTDAQLEACAYFAAIDSIATGLDIVRGETVLTHADINSVDRQNCAFRPVIRESRLAVICRRALEIRALLKEEPDVPGLTITDIAAAPGVVTVKNIAGVQAVQVDDPTQRFGMPPGTTKDTVAIGRLVGDPLGKDSPGNDRHTVRLIGTELAVLLAGQVEFTAAPAPEPDCIDAVAAEHERTRSAAIAAVEAI